jgi:hypothetical protein
MCQIESVENTFDSLLKSDEIERRLEDFHSGSMFCAFQGAML